MKRLFPIAGISLPALLVVLALGSTQPATAETGLQPLRAGQETTEPAPEGGGDTEAAEAILNTACTACHPLADYGIAPGLRTSAQWEEVINRMISYGASVSDEQYQTLLDHLATDAPGSGVDVEAAQALLNSNCTTCHPLADYGIEPGLRTSAQWEEVINRMISYGASVSDEQYQLLLDYLATDAPGSGVDVEAAQALLNSNCTTCHPLADYGVEPGIYTAAEWLETLDRMISYGASLTDPQKQLLLDYLGTD